MFTCYFWGFGPAEEGNNLTNEALEDALQFQVAVFDEAEPKVAPGNAPEPGPSPEPEAAHEEEGLVYFGSSAWTFPVVIGLAPAGCWDVTFAVLLLLLNLGMQATHLQANQPFSHFGSPELTELVHIFN